MTQQTLEQLLHQQISTFVESDKPKEIIDEHVEKMFKSVIDNAFRTYGDMGKAVEEAIKAAMPGNIGDMMGLTRYNNLVANAIREKWEGSGVAADMVRRAQESVEEVLKDFEIPEAISLKELLEAFIEDHAEEATENGWERPRVVCEEEGSFFHLYFDKDPDEASRYSTRSKYALDNNLAARIEVDNDPNHGGYQVARVYAAKLDGDVMGKRMGVWHSKYDKLVIALYYGEAKLILDCDPDNFSYPGYD